MTKKVLVTYGANKLTEHYIGPNNSIRKNYKLNATK